MSEVDNFKYVNINILLKYEKTGEFNAIHTAGFGVADRPFKDDFIQVDGIS